MLCRLSHKSTYFYQGFARYRGARVTSIQASGSTQRTTEADSVFVRSREEGGLAAIGVVHARSRLGSLGTHGAWLIRLSGPALLRASSHHVYLVCAARCATWRGRKIKRTAVDYNTHSGANLFDIHSYHYDLNVVFYLCTLINIYKFYNLYGK